MNRISIPNSKLKELYTDRCYSCADLANLAGVSRIAIWKKLQKLNVITKKGQNKPTLVCSHCHKSFTINRKKFFRSTTTHPFCSKTCYFAFMRNPNYIQNRWGTKLGRKSICEYLSLSTLGNGLPYSSVIHHINSNKLNNNIKNLVLFASSSDHQKFHHNVNPVTPIYDGSKNYLNPNYEITLINNNISNPLYGLTLKVF